MDKKKTVNIDMKQYGMVLALIAVFLIFAVMTGGKNMSPANINNLIMQNGYVVILAVGMLLCCLTGNIDLGVGSIVALCGATVGILMIDYHTNMWVAILAALAVGALAGWLTRSGIQLYTQTVTQPPLAPPPIVFPIVWAVLYALMGIGGARVFLSVSSLSRTRGLVLYLLQIGRASCRERV